MDYSKLISAVYNERVLWDPREKQYKNNILRMSTWKEISKIFYANEDHADECQETWKRLREKYNREKKKLSEESRSGSSGGKKSLWVHFNEVRFLDTVYKKRRTYQSLGSTSEPNDDLFSDNSEDIRLASFEQLSPSGKINNNSSSDANQNDVSDLINIAKSFTTHQSSKFREFGNYIVKVLEELDDQKASLLEDKILQSIIEIKNM